MAHADVEDIAASAMRAHRAGQLGEAERLCRLALDSSPDYFRSIVHLAVLLRHRGEFDESATMAGRAIGIQPQSVEGYVQLGLCLLGTGRPDESEAVFLRAISVSPKLAPLYFNLGLALENQGKVQDAKRAFLEATRLAPSDVRSRLSLGSLLLSIENDIQGANAQAETAMRLDPQSGAAHLLKAKVLVAEGRGVESEVSMRRALALEPALSFAHTMLGFRLLQTGDFKGAEKSFRRSLELDPAQGVAYFGIAQARKIVEQDRSLVREMERGLDGTALTLEQASYLNFALAKAFDNLGDCEKAMEHYDDAHECANQYRFGNARFDASAYASEIAAIKSLYSKELIETGIHGFQSDLPIFIVGMMRSGTTLTEQILSSHPQVGAAGEHEFWARRGREAENFEKGQFSAQHASSLARQYCRDLRKILPGSSRITDKLPGNYQRLGLIHLALPNAKIIHCRRSPVDTALSIYFTANPTAPAYSHTKEGIVFAYRQYQDLMDHWRCVMPPDCFLEVQYEDLVSRPESEIRRMLEFLGLDWNDACLHHDKNAKDVRTPSLWQVRQPMYSTSVGRWRRFEPWLGVLKDLVDPKELTGNYAA